MESYSVSRRPHCRVPNRKRSVYTTYSATLAGTVAVRQTSWVPGAGEVWSPSHTDSTLDSLLVRNLRFPLLYICRKINIKRILHKEHLLSVGTRVRFRTFFLYTTLPNWFPVLFIVRPKDKRNCDYSSLLDTYRDTLIVPRFLVLALSPLRSFLKLKTRNQRSTLCTLLHNYRYLRVLLTLNYHLRFNSIVNLKYFLCVK